MAVEHSCTEQLEDLKRQDEQQQQQQQQQEEQQEQHRSWKRNCGTVKKLLHKFRQLTDLASVNFLDKNYNRGSDSASHNVDDLLENGVNLDEGEGLSFEDDFSNRTEPSNSDPRKRLEAFWTFDTASYDFRRVTHWYMEVEKYIRPKDMKFLVDFTDRKVKDNFGKVMRTQRRPAVHSLLDKLVTEFCSRLGMTQVQRMPSVEERMFLWFSRPRATKHLNSSTGTEQMYFINYINWDQMLTDLQCLVSRLRLCSLKEGQTFPDHTCTDLHKVQEVVERTGEQLREELPKPKMLFIERQTICEHVYNSREFNEPCSDPNCFNHGVRMCSCFQLNLFIPETIVLATKTKFEEVLHNFRTGKYSGHRWLIRASNLKNGNGVQFIDTADELESFLRYDSRKKLRGHFFVLQRYVPNPLLLNDHKFECRMFLLICVLTDRRVLGFLHPGFVRVAQLPYDPASNDLRRHLAAPFTFDEDYNRYNNEEASLLPDYCSPYNEVCNEVGLPPLVFSTIDQVLAHTGEKFARKLSTISQQLVRHMESVVQDKPGTWQLFGVDLFVDAEHNPWLHEIMTYPSSAEPDTSSHTQNLIMPGVVTEALSIVFELNQKDWYTRRQCQWINLPDVPWNKEGLIAAQRNFLWVYSTNPYHLISFKEPVRPAPLHWYQQWRVTEDFNDYILYLRNFRCSKTQWQQDTTQYGRKTFDCSPALKAKAQLRETVMKEQEKVRGKESDGVE